MCADEPEPDCLDSMGMGSGDRVRELLIRMHMMGEAWCYCLCSSTVVVASTLNHKEMHTVFCHHMNRNVLKTLIESIQCSSIINVQFLLRPECLRIVVACKSACPKP